MQETDELRYCIYVIRNVNNGLQYVGRTGALKTRWRYHIRDMKAGSHTYLHNAIRKHGEHNFTFEVVDRCADEEESFTLEKDWVKKLGTLAPGGYNLNEGGRGSAGYPYAKEMKRRGVVIGSSLIGRKASESTKKAISVALRKHYLTNSYSLKGKPRDEDVKRKISKTKTGKIYTLESCAKMSAAALGRVPWNKGKKTGPLPRPDGAAKRGVVTRETNRLAKEYPGIFDLEIDEQ